MRSTRGLVPLAAAVTLVAAACLLAPGASAQACVGCHREATPQIVDDWQLSKHSGASGDCETCHGSDHKGAGDVAKAKLPTPDTCADCHETQVAQFKKGKHALAWASMEAMPTIHAQPVAMTYGMKGCGGCHKIGLKSEADLKKISADGSRTFGNASCDACHTRHTFSVKEAKQPQACQTCHMGFDHPQWEMYSASKHGVRALLRQNGTLPATTPAPTCQDCHMAGGSHDVRTAWGFPRPGHPGCLPLPRQQRLQRPGLRSQECRPKPAHNRHPGLLLPLGHASVLPDRGCRYLVRLEAAHFRPVREGAVEPPADPFHRRLHPPDSRPTLLPVALPDQRRDIRRLLHRFPWFAALGAQPQDLWSGRLSPVVHGFPVLLLFARLASVPLVSGRVRPAIPFQADASLPVSGWHTCLHLPSAGRRIRRLVAMYTKDKKLKYCYNLLGLQRFYIESTNTLPSGVHQVRMEFAYDGGGLAKGGNVTLFVDGNKVGEGRLPATIPMVFSADETTDIGYESASSVSEDYSTQSSAFNGKIRWIQLDVGVDDFDHFITPEERLRVAMARQ